jgi:S-formylglutathione hydrolase FrmB
MREASTQVLSTTGAVTVTDVRFPSPSIASRLWYRAIVPTVAPGERLPVLYLLHGANSDANEMQQSSEAVKYATAERLIVVIPDAHNSYYTNAKHRHHARWEDAIAFDLPHDAEARFPILPDREHRGVAGISMGGYGAVKLALKHPDLYSFAGTMSGAFDITRRSATLHRPIQTLRIWTLFGLHRSVRQDEDIFILLNHAPTSQLQNTKWFVSCGKADVLYPVNTRFLHEMHTRGIPIKGVFTPGIHDWQTWTPTMPLLFKAASEALH